MDIPLRISPLAEGVGLAWLSLMNSGLRDCPGFEPLVSLDYQRMWGGDRARAGLTLAAERGGELVGAVSLIFGTRRGRLRDLVVRPDARRCGTGTALVEAALDCGSGRGLPRRAPCLLRTAGRPGARPGHAGGPGACQR